MRTSKTFPGQKVLSIWFLRPSKLRIMEDVSAFKDFVVHSLMLSAICLALFCLPRLVLQRAVGWASSFSWTELLVKPAVNTSPEVVVTGFSLYQQDVICIFQSWSSNPAYVLFRSLHKLLSIELEISISNSMGEKLPKFFYFKLRVWNRIKISNPLYIPCLVFPPCFMNWHPCP